MAVIGELLVIGSLILFIIGMVRPRWTLPGIAAPTRPKVVVVAAAVFALGTVIGVNSVDQSPQGVPSSVPTQSPAQPAIAPPIAAPPPSLQSLGYPTIEIAVISAVEVARQQYKAAANDLAKGAARPARGRAICDAAHRTGAVSDWAGRVAVLSSNNDGKGVLGIDIGNGITVKTWNNAMSDVGDRTLIDPSSAVFAVAAQLKAGQLVHFSGTFMPSDVDCFKESSMTLDGSMDEPEFIFRFQSIRP